VSKSKYLVRIFSFDYLAAVPGRSTSQYCWYFFRH